MSAPCELSYPDTVSPGGQASDKPPGRKPRDQLMRVSGRDELWGFEGSRWCEQWR
jgi:hypothetical protein